jgi:hypothetical protein
MGFDFISCSLMTLILPLLGQGQGKVLSALAKAGDKAHVARIETTFTPIRADGSAEPPVPIAIEVDASQSKKVKQQLLALEARRSQWEGAATSQPDSILQRLEKLEQQIATLKNNTMSVALAVPQPPDTSCYYREPFDSPGDRPHFATWRTKDLEWLIGDKLFQGQLTEDKLKTWTVNAWRREVIDPLLLSMLPLLEAQRKAQEEAESFGNGCWISR